ncbi:unnamed protein product, partial [Brassica oleracea var. botrytis]
GTKIHASCKKTYWDKIAKKVPVGMWRNIENFSVTNPGATYRSTNHQYKLNFIYGTDVTPSTLQNDIMFLSLVDFQTIQQGVEDENIFIESLPQFMQLTRIGDGTILDAKLATKRFRVHVRVKDGTGEAYLMLLDWIALGVIPENAAALLNGSFDEV